MSNLGLYQDFTTAAKKAGGVEPYLRVIKMRHVGIGITLGVSVGVVGTCLAAVIDQKVQEHRARKARQQVRLG